ncbi:transcriptional regulator [Hoyosella subflava]|uniref:transcriptional regulator n=1 Tax=Hoyosella subflava TaxID=639313 RepID=UPI001ED8F794|nr:transcriptional regulator [Hoyosella subflava]
MHQPVRLSILAILAGGTEVDFRYLISELGLSDGNLGRHLTTLHEAGLIHLKEGYNGSRTRTWISLTPQGETAFKREAELLKPIIAAAEQL